MWMREQNVGERERELEIPGDRLVPKLFIQTISKRRGDGGGFRGAEGGFLYVRGHTKAPPGAVLFQWERFAVRPHWAV